MQANSIMSLAGAADCDIPILTKLAQKVGTAASAMESTGVKSLKLAKNNIVEDCGLYGNSCAADQFYAE